MADDGRRAGVTESRRSIRAAAVGLALVAAIIVFALIRDGSKQDDGAGSASESSSSPDSTASKGGESGSPASSTSAGASGGDTGGSGSASKGTPSPSVDTDAPGATDDPGTAPQGVQVYITSQGYNAATQSIEIAAGVLGSATEKSTCTALATMGATTASVDSGGEFDGHGVSCGLMSIPMAGKPAGTYSVVVSYTAGAVQAASPPVDVTVG